ncbi:MAG: hypothetical protein KJO29_12735 [Bacteroidia bacterium]|nr:hypothetical protein [Bacteroidia bacterium]
MLRILSWNIRQGGGTRINKILNKVTESESDIIIISEFRNGRTGQVFRSSLLKHGYRFQNVSAALPSDNSVAIFSKIPCQQLIYKDACPFFPHNIVCSVYDAFRIYGVYMPHKKKHKLFEFLTKESKQHENLIIAGDYNSGKNYIDQKGNSFWYTDQLTQLEESGMEDAFRLKHVDIAEYSWFSHKGNGFRYDHIYMNKVLTPVLSDCYYEHSWREKGLSDHSPMFLELA